MSKKGLTALDLFDMRIDNSVSEETSEKIRALYVNGFCISHYLGSGSTLISYFENIWRDFGVVKEEKTHYPLDIDIAVKAPLNRII